MLCKICNKEMENQPATVDNWVCKEKHGGTQPKVGAAVLSCPLAKGAIWVHVIDDDGEDVPDAIPATVAGTEKSTVAAFASWDPLDDAKKYRVAIGTLPDAFLPLAVTTAEDVVVRKGEITSVQFVLERAAKMTVIVKAGDAPGSIEDIKIDVAATETADKRTGKTVKTTGAPFTKLRKGPHTVTFTLDEPQKKKYWIDGDATKTWNVVPTGPNIVEFTLQLITKIELKFHIQEKIPTGLKELEGAKIKLKEPAEEKTAALDETKAIAKFEIVVASKTPQSAVDVLSLTPDGTDAMYEVVEIVSA